MGRLWVLSEAGVVTEAVQSFHSWLKCLLSTESDMSETSPLVSPLSLSQLYHLLKMGTLSLLRISATLLKCD